MNNFLPTILSLFSGPRYFPEFKWNNLWTHNIFRVYELIFGRKAGIRAEMTCRFDKDSATYQAHSFEAVCTLAEVWIRELKFKWPVKIWIPRFSSPMGLPNLNSPFWFAIAADTDANFHSTGAVTSYSAAYTVTGSNPILFAGPCLPKTCAATMTYNSVSMAEINKKDQTVSSQRVYLFVLPACATGSNTAVVTQDSGGGECMLASYSGAKQTGQPDSSSIGGPTDNALTQATTVVASNCWIVWVGYVFDGTTTFNNSMVEINTGTTNYGVGISDSQGTVATGSVSYTATRSIGEIIGVMASFAPFVAASGPANLKSYNTNLKANIKSIDTNLLANIKSLDTNV